MIYVFSDFFNKNPSRNLKRCKRHQYEAKLEMNKGNDPTILHSADYKVTFPGGYAIIFCYLDLEIYKKSPIFAALLLMNSKLNM